MQENEDIVTRLRDEADKRKYDGDEALVSLLWEASAIQPCGHPASLLLHSAETGEPLYCELCDAQSGRRDAEHREAELAEANARLRTTIATLREEVEGLRADAERWRHASRSRNFGITFFGKYGQGFCYDSQADAMIDAAIDAAKAGN